VFQSNAKWSGGWLVSCLVFGGVVSWACSVRAADTAAQPPANGLLRPAVGRFTTRTTTPAPRQWIPPLSIRRLSRRFPISPIDGLEAGRSPVDRATRSNGRGQSGSADNAPQRRTPVLAGNEQGGGCARPARRQACRYESDNRTSTEGAAHHEMPGTSSAKAAA